MEGQVINEFPGYPPYISGSNSGLGAREYREGKILRVFQN